MIMGGETIFMYSSSSKTVLPFCVIFFSLSLRAEHCATRVGEWQLTIFTSNLCRTSTVVLSFLRLTHSTVLFNLFAQRELSYFRVMRSIKCCFLQHVEILLHFFDVCALQSTQFCRSPDMLWFFWRVLHTICRLNFNNVCATQVDMTKRQQLVDWHPRAKSTMCDTIDVLDWDRERERKRNCPKKTNNNCVYRHRLIFEVSCFFTQLLLWALSRRTPLLSRKKYRGSLPLQRGTLSTCINALGQHSTVDLLCAHTPLNVNANSEIKNIEKKLSIRRFSYSPTRLVI